MKFIIGNVIENDRFSDIYAILSNLSAVESYQKDFPIFEENQLQTVEYALDFPIFFIEEILEKKTFYQIIKKEGLKSRVSKITEKQHLYFNLWRIDKDSVNTNYTEEPLLNGRDWHLHFTDFELAEIESLGFDAFWSKIMREQY